MTDRTLVEKDIEQVCIEYMESYGTSEMEPSLIFFYLAQKGYRYEDIWDTAEEMGLIPNEWEKVRR